MFKIVWLKTFINQDKKKKNINMLLLRLLCMKDCSISFQVMSVWQVGGGHSVQWQVGAGEPSCQRRLQADGRGGHEHPGQPEQGRLEVHTHTHTDHTHWWFDTCILEELRALSWHGDWSQKILIVCIDYWQGAEGSGHRDGYVHRHVVPLSADQDHEECPDTDTQVRAATMTSHLSQHTCTVSGVCLSCYFHRTQQCCL